MKKKQQEAIPTGISLREIVLIKRVVAVAKNDAERTGNPMNMQQTLRDILAKEMERRGMPAIGAEATK